MLDRSAGRWKTMIWVATGLTKARSRNTLVDTFCKIEDRYISLSGFKILCPPQQSITAKYLIPGEPR